MLVVLGCACGAGSVAVAQDRLEVRAIDFPHGSNDPSAARAVGQQVSAGLLGVEKPRQRASTNSEQNQSFYQSVTAPPLQAPPKNTASQPGDMTARTSPPPDDFAVPLDPAEA